MLPDIGLSGLLSLLASAAALMASPGPATLSVAATAAAYGFRRSLSYVMGINLGTILVLLAMALGASTLLYALPGLALPISIAASLYILYLAYRIATAPPLADKTNEPSPGLMPGLLLAMANPKAYLAIGAVYSKAVLITIERRCRCGPQMRDPERRHPRHPCGLGARRIGADRGAAQPQSFARRESHPRRGAGPGGGRRLFVSSPETSADLARSLPVFAEFRLELTGKVGFSYTWRPKGSF